MSEPSRRLSDKILDAFNTAIDQKDVELASQLYQGFELSLTRYGGKGSSDTRDHDGFISEAHDRLVGLKVELGA